MGRDRETDLLPSAGSLGSFSVAFPRPSAWYWKSPMKNEVERWADLGAEHFWNPCIVLFCAIFHALVGNLLPLWVVLFWSITPGR